MVDAMRQQETIGEDAAATESEATAHAETPGQTAIDGRVPPSAAQSDQQTPDSEEARTAESSAVAGTQDAAADTGENPAPKPSETSPKRGRPRKKGGARGVELVLTVVGSAEGTDWKAEVTHAGKRVVTDVVVPATAVSAAAKDLHPDIAQAIETVLDVAREQQRARVEQLQAELGAAQRALAELED